MKCKLGTAYRIVLMFETRIVPIYRSVYTMESAEMKHHQGKRCHSQSYYVADQLWMEENRRFGDPLPRDALTN